jgi:hypothetical protein
VTDDLPIEIHAQTGPWAMVPGWVLHVGLTGNELAVYVALRTFAGRTGEAWPRISVLADRAGVSRSTVDRALARLRQLDLVRSRTNRRPDGSVTGSRYWLRDVPPQDVIVTPSPDLPERHRDVPPTSAGDVPPTSPADVAGTHQGTPHGTEELMLTADAASERQPGDAQLTQEFGAWWRHYPRKTGKGSALPSYKRARRQVSCADLLAAVQVYAADPNLPEPRYIPHPSRWLNDARWLDGPLPARTDKQPAMVARNSPAPDTDYGWS